MTGPEIFRATAPALIAAAAKGDASLQALARQALRGLQHYDLPIGVKVPLGDLFPEAGWVFACPIKLESPNYFMRDFRIRSGLRRKWTKQLQTVVARAEGFASFAGLQSMGRAPRVSSPMAVQVIRFVPTSRMFLRDTDNSAFCTKQLSDAMADVGLLREDRREWFTSAPLIQDTSTLGAFTLVILRPQVAGLLPGVTDQPVQKRRVRPSSRLADDTTEQLGESRVDDSIPEGEAVHLGRSRNV